MTVCCSGKVTVPPLLYIRGSANVNTFTEFMVQAEADTVPAVVFVGETLTVVDTAVFELAICFSRVYASQPVVLPMVFCAMNSMPIERPLPISTFSSQLVELPKKETPVLVFQYVSHLFVISFNGELPTPDSGIISA